MKDWFFDSIVKSLEAMTLDYEACFLVCLKNGIPPTRENILEIVNKNNKI